MMVLMVVMVDMGFEREARRNWVNTAEKFSEEETSGCKHTAMSVHYAAIDTKGDVAEGLAVDEEVEVVEGERFEGVIGRRGHGWSERILVHI